MAFLGLYTCKVQTAEQLQGGGKLRANKQTTVYQSKQKASTRGPMDLQVGALPPSLVLHHEFCKLLAVFYCAASQRAFIKNKTV